MLPHPLLNSETLRVGGALVCTFTGDMTLDSGPVADQTLNAALDQCPVLLAVDLAGVEFLASTGLNVLLTARRRALAEGIPLVLIAPPPQTLQGPRSHRHHRAVHRLRHHRRRSAAPRATHTFYLSASPRSHRVPARVRDETRRSE
ncbi:MULTISPECIES: STAS domain-containing protein [unclassified Kitasatospora]|uniref:STAS domain-containing protein n=1 Tax=unclassified Kitasatospora TaxID=2633591 RepID=UPI0033EC6B0A